MTDNVVQFTDNVPIFNTSGQLSFACPPDICNIGTVDLDITFSGLSNCTGGGCGTCESCFPAASNSCSQNLNGNTFQMVWNGGTVQWENTTAMGGDSCGGSSQYIFIRLQPVCVSGFFLLHATLNSSGGSPAPVNICFCFVVNTELVAPLPHTVLNLFILGQCCTGAGGSIQIGYNGQAVIDLH